MASYVEDKTDPTGIKDLTPKGNSEVIRARRRKAHAAVAMRIDHYTWDDIAQAQGYPNGKYARQAVEKALEDELFTEESQVQLRKMFMLRYDRLLRTVWGAATNPDSPELYNAQRAVRDTMAEMRRMTGMDAPQKHIVATPTTSEIQAWVDRVLAAETPALEEADIFADDVIEGDVLSEASEASEPSVH